MVVIGVVLAAGAVARAAPSSPSPVVVSVEGTARVVDGLGAPLAIPVGARLPPGARVTTGRDGFVGVRLGEGAALGVEPESDVVVGAEGPLAHHVVRRGAVRVTVGAGGGTVLVVTRAARARFSGGLGPTAGSVAAHDLEATIAADEGVVDVEGRGAHLALARGLWTRIDRGDPPRRPRPSTPPPSWRTPPPALLLTTAAAPTLSVELEASGAGPRRRRVEVARDAAFIDRVSVIDLDGDSARIGTTPGTFYVRTVARDVGVGAALPSTARAVRVVALALERVDAALSRVAPPSSEVRCVVDGATPSQRGGLLIDRRVAQTVRCAVDVPGGEALRGAVEIPALDLPVTIAPKLEYADDERGVGRVSVLLSDVTGAPAKGRSLAVSPSSDDIEVREIAELDYPGLYVVRLRWKPGRRELPLSIAVGGSNTVAVALAIPRG